MTPLTTPGLFCLSFSTPTSFCQSEIKCPFKNPTHPDDSQLFYDFIILYNYYYYVSNWFVFKVVMLIVGNGWTFQSQGLSVVSTIFSSLEVCD